TVPSIEPPAAASTPAPSASAAPADSASVTAKGTPHASTRTPTGPAPTATSRRDAGKAAAPSPGDFDIK
ncbi:MAG TPA: WYL domain-containing protein, partial [Polyangiaceae bacterium]|nr:WYL domain-containing protein [Polyangiaceae bacterium]